MRASVENLATGGSFAGRDNPAEQSSASRKKMGLSPGVPAETTPRKMTTLGKRVVKGGLSVFLSGALDEPEKVVLAPAPVTPKIEGPAWGGANVVLQGSTSLLAIQSQQKAEPKLVFSKAVKVGSGNSSTGERSGGSIKHLPLSKPAASTKQAEKSQVVTDDNESSTKRVPLSQFVRTSPIAVTKIGSSPGVHPENSPPPWAASTSSPAPSLRDIQLQQVKSKGPQRAPNPRGSPNLASPVGAPTLLAGGSSLEPNLNQVDTPSRWFKPEVESRSTLRCIQIEEEAMKELRQLYKNVKLVRNDGG